MRILGVDPGSLTTGWGLVEQQHGRCLLVEGGIIRLAEVAGTLCGRLAHLQQELDRLVARLQPACAAVEMPFHGVNARSALQLAHARGVILAVLATAGLSVAEYSPATVKKSVTGNGRATKDQVRSMVGQLLGARTPRPSLDLSDALAVALCHATSRRYLARVERASTLASQRVRGAVSGTHRS